MKQNNKLIITSIFSSLITALIFSYLAAKGTTHSLVNKFREVEVFNEIGRVEIWSDIEELLNKGCSSEALEYVKNEKASSLSEIQSQAEGRQHLLKLIEKRNPEILKLVKNNKYTGSYKISTCK